MSKETHQAERERLVKEAVALMAAGDREGGKALLRKVPIPVEVLLGIKQDHGVDALRRMGRNYIEAEELYGKDWLDK